MTTHSMPRPQKFLPIPVMLLSSEMLTVAKNTLMPLLENELKNLKNPVLSAKFSSDLGSRLAECMRIGNGSLARSVDVPSALFTIHLASSTP